jgi:hypothetical protein
MTVHDRDALVLVLLPASDRFTDLYANTIKPACEGAGAICERIDEQHFLESVLRQTSDEILAADLIIAEITEQRPAFFYEIGYAHAFARATLMLAKRSVDIPFDIKHRPLIVYDDLVYLGNEIKRHVIELLQRTRESPATVTFFPWPQLIRRALTILEAGQALFKRCHGNTSEFVAMLPGLAATFGARNASDIQLSLASPDRKLLFHDHAELIGHAARYIGSDRQDIYDEIFAYKHGAVAWLDSISNTPRRPRVRRNVALFDEVAVSGMKLVVEMHEELR